MLCGHKDLSEKFLNLFKKGNLFQGYIFFGESQLGKFSFALSLVNFLENGVFSMPQKMLSETLIVEKSGIDCAREVKNFLWQKPLNSQKRTVIIDNADLLTPEAQNAILKIAEEPPMHSLIILIANNPDNLLPSIISRLHKIYFSRCGNKEIGDFLIQNLKIDKKKALEIAEAACGKPGKAVDLINKKELTGIKNNAGKFLKSSGLTRSQIIKDLIEEQKEKPEILDYFFEFLLVELRRNSIANCQTIKTLLNRLFLIKSYNVNKRIQMEAINTN